MTRGTGTHTSVSAPPDPYRDDGSRRERALEAAPGTTGTTDFEADIRRIKADRDSYEG